MAEVEETLNRIKTHKGVRGVIVLGADGAVLRSTLDAQQTAAYAGAASQLSERARSLVRDLDPQNDVTFLRVRSKKHEILLAPDGEYLLLSADFALCETDVATTDLQGKIFTYEIRRRMRTTVLHARRPIKARQVGGAGAF
ncbi:dynein light chain roadblock-type [Cyclospora cayetanensis]|uniref:Dynein light chain roadblock-type n=1 Tax=Cyclospora cayetanensis TaxID=88456 RepID=A0A1D3D5I6_9EIME|nr:dynein light chain roadblock-type [Cyclospora cayetanensis]